jgi:hypothetical protein
MDIIKYLILYFLEVCNMKTTLVEVKETALETFLSIGEATAPFLNICSIKYDSVKDQMVIKLCKEVNNKKRKKFKLIIKGISKNKDVRALVFNMQEFFLQEKQKAKETAATQKEEGS